MRPGQEQQHDFRCTRLIINRKGVGNMHWLTAEAFLKSDNVLNLLYLSTSLHLSEHSVREAKLKC